MAIPYLPIAEILTSPRSSVSWLVPEFIPQGSLIVLGGEPGAGKSFLSYAVSMALATGTPLLGWEMTPSRVLYFDQENSRPDAEQYLKWIWNGLGRPDPALVEENFRLAHFALGGPGWVKQAEMHVHETQPHLIIIDTTTPACHIQDENDNAEAARAITYIRRLQALTEPTAAAIVLKHAKLRADDGGYTMRGAKTWEGATDSVIYHAKMRGRPPKGEGLRPTKVEPSKTRAFGLREGFKIVPRWTGEERAGVILQREALIDEIEEVVEQQKTKAEGPPRRRQRWQKPRAR